MGMSVRWFMVSPDSSKNILTLFYLCSLNSKANMGIIILQSHFIK